MREHEIQIQKYTKMLPRMRERVVAALALLLIAAVMMVSASFAWVVEYRVDVSETMRIIDAYLSLYNVWIYCIEKCRMGQ